MKHPSDNYECKQIDSVELYPQVASIWRLSIITAIWLVWDCRNKMIFDETPCRTSKIVATLWAIIKEANGANLGRMYDTGFDLQVLSTFGIRGCPTPAPGIK
ncbi:hypothetical protein ACS0TY_036108 [Phlomoides rotata]